MVRPRPIRLVAFALAAAVTAVAVPAAAMAAGDTAPADRAPVAAARHRPATTATRIPEPDTIALFLMSSAGLVIGRRLSRVRRRRPDA
ncbi:hypothetical protein [Sphingomonas profundi]|uniref:hypothetical protein n=1 Tax=Alterirhizorhabdus profundi TaxID=2681549 RepID=UPI0012E6FDBF|nr:hypothetical protein [Sphingomonas profundi]